MASRLHCITLMQYFLDKETRGKSKEWVCPECNEVHLSQNKRACDCELQNIRQKAKEEITERIEQEIIDSLYKDN